MPRAPRPAPSPAPDAQAWFQHRGWTPFDFQREVWAAMTDGRSGLLHATTGAGKTYAVWFAALGRALRQRASGADDGRGLRVLWLTPMRALATDTRRALEAPLAELLPSWRVGLRTGDTPSAERARNRRPRPW